ncbi:unnamed protein product [Dovyalis caffra]|uniref:Uncharacterized protein n=1 Tax=Dovyalis caffra TaxID=77055 RepID=A0AAV1R283_9ROSI|nr:unnamed protein product [Dovyalis caffra]
MTSASAASPLIDLDVDDKRLMTGNPIINACQEDESQETYPFHFSILKGSSGVSIKRVVRIQDQTESGQQIRIAILMIMQVCIAKKDLSGQQTPASLVEQLVHYHQDAHDDTSITKE